MFKALTQRRSTKSDDKAMSVPSIQSETDSNRRPRSRSKKRKIGSISMSEGDILSVDDQRCHKRPKVMISNITPSTVTENEWSENKEPLFTSFALDQTPARNHNERMTQFRRQRVLNAVDLSSASKSGSGPKPKDCREMKEIERVRECPSGGELEDDHNDEDEDDDDIAELEDLDDEMDAVDPRRLSLDEHPLMLRRHEMESVSIQSQRESHKLNSILDSLLAAKGELDAQRTMRSVPDHKIPTIKEDVNYFDEMDDALILEALNDCSCDQRTSSDIVEQMEEELDSVSISQTVKRLSFDHSNPTVTEIEEKEEAPSTPRTQKKQKSPAIDLSPNSIREKTQSQWVTLFV